MTKRLWQQFSKQPSRQSASESHTVAVVVAAPEHQAVREAIFCTQLQDATGLQNPAYLGQHPTLTIFRRQLGDLLGAPLKNEIEDDDIIGIVRIG